MKHVKQLGAVCVGLITAACSQPAGEDADRATQTPAPIINGTPVAPDSIAPFMGVVEVIDPTGFGTGVLLRNDWVLTAQHLFLDDDGLRLPESSFRVYAPGRRDQDAGTKQQSAIDRVLFHPLGARVDVALAHLASRIKTLDSETQHKLQFYQGPFVADADGGPDNLFNQPVRCYGYGDTAVNQDAALSEYLMYGESFVASVNQPYTSADGGSAGSLNVHMNVRPGSLGQLPASGDSGGPCFYGPGLISIVHGGTSSSDVEVQSDAFQSWTDQIMFEIAASEFEDTTSAALPPTASSDMLTTFTDPDSGYIFPLAALMGTHPDSVGNSVPELRSLALIPPYLPSTVPVSPDETFRVAVRGIGEFNGDFMADMVVSWEATLSGVPYQWVFAYLSDGPNERSTMMQLFVMTNADGWQIVSVADIDGDGLSDLIWRKELPQWEGYYAVTGLGRDTDGNVTALASFPIPAFPQRDATDNDIPGTRDPAWRLVGAGDFDRATVSENNRVRDLTSADFLWHNQTTGDVELWAMGFDQGVGSYKVLGTFNVSSRDPSRYEVVAFGDYTQDGMPDIVWRDRATEVGLLDIWALGWSSPGELNRTPINIESSSGNQLGLSLDLQFAGPR